MNGILCANRFYPLILQEVEVVPRQERSSYPQPIMAMPAPRALPLYESSLAQNVSTPALPQKAQRTQPRLAEIAHDGPHNEIASIGRTKRYSLMPAVEVYDVDPFPGRTLSEYPAPRGAMLDSLSNPIDKQKSWEAKCHALRKGR